MTTATPRVDDVGRVPAAAHADLDDGDVHGRVGEGRVRHAGQHLEEGQPVLLLGVDHLDVRLDVVVRLDEPLGGDRRAVQADPLGDRLDVRARCSGRCAVRRRSSRASIMRAVRVLPLVPVMWIEGYARCGSPRTSISARDAGDARAPAWSRPSGWPAPPRPRAAPGRPRGPRAGPARVGLRRAGLGAQGAAAGLDHREVGVAVGLRVDDLVEARSGSLAHGVSATEGPRTGRLTRPSLRYGPSGVR